MRDKVAKQEAAARHLTETPGAETSPGAAQSSVAAAADDHDMDDRDNQLGQIVGQLLGAAVGEADDTEEAEQGATGAAGASKRDKAVAKAVNELKSVTLKKCSGKRA